MCVCVCVHKKHTHTQTYIRAYTHTNMLFHLLSLSLLTSIPPYALACMRAFFQTHTKTHRMSLKTIFWIFKNVDVICMILHRTSASKSPLSHTHTHTHTHPHTNTHYLSFMCTHILAPYHTDLRTCCYLVDFFFWFICPQHFFEKNFFGCTDLPSYRYSVDSFVQFRLL